MSVKIINSKQRILSISPDMLPEDKRGHILVLYLPFSNYIALNEDSPVLNEMEEMIGEYLSLNDWQRKACMDEIGNYKTENDIREIMQVINRVIRIRRKLNQHATA